MAGTQKINEKHGRAPKIKLIALDLDGTTLGEAGISPATVAVLEKAIRKGVHVVIATGRVFCSLPEDVFRIRGLEYVINSNGAHITYLPEQEVIYSNCIGASDILAVADILEANRVHPIEVFTEGRAYIDEEVYHDLAQSGSDFMNAAYVLATRTPVTGIYDFLRRHSDSIENINIHFRDLGDKADFWRMLGQRPGITVTSSVKHNLEIGGATTSKAAAIAWLCGRLAIGEENVMACGDSPNDIAMLKAAGLGVAVGNAEEEVKEIADFISRSNLEDGVAYAVKKFVLGEE